MSTGDQGDGPRYYPSGPSSGQYSQYPQNPYGPGATGDPYAYTPYAQQPAGLPPVPAAPARRPGTVIGAFVLAVLSALPFLVLGVLGMAVPITEDMFPAELGLPAMLTQYGVSFDQFLQAVRLMLALIAVLAVVYVALAAAAFARRGWGRVAVTVLTVLFDLFLLLNVGGAGSGAAIVLLPVLLSAAGVALLYVRPSAAWFARL
ncbi:hypothetical protein [Pseudonocardia pini]|uniref:hypothetical protein n=1 Tax=Pseudonocardia pini TaxID=2758030 RepID=UPI0015F032AA|nr:hypothetical protein [Pseudonocardia pini]